jgi:hypothetical protein
MGERRTILISAVVLVLGAGILGLWLLTPRGNPAQQAGLMEVTDSATLKDSVALSHLGIRTSTNYLGHRIYTVHGRLKNNSINPIRMIEVRMTFVDQDQKPVQESIHQAFEPKWKPLEPGTEYEFSLAFENLPRTWNYRVPSTEVYRIAY